MVNPKTIFERTIAECPSVLSTNVCNLHRPCRKDLQCSNPQTKDVINFDAIKDIYCKKENIDPLPSVDALTYTQKSLVMAEIKGSV